VTGSEHEWQIRQALAQGAAAYLLLGTTGEELVSAVRSASRGGCHLSDSVSAKLAQSLTVEALTARRKTVLAMLTAGLCNKHIAARLGISVGTVKRICDRRSKGCRCAAAPKPSRRQGDGESFHAQACAAKRKQRTRFLRRTCAAGSAGQPVPHRLER